jgi:hypothetical protein
LLPSVTVVDHHAVSVKGVLRIGGHLAHHGVAVGPGDWRYQDQEVASEPRAAAPINDVSAVMGHEQTSTTLDRYTHPSQDRDQRVRTVFADS